MLHTDIRMHIKFIIDLFMYKYTNVMLKLRKETVFKRNLFSWANIIHSVKHPIKMRIKNMHVSIFT